MAMYKTGNAVVVTPIVDPGKWIDKKVPSSRIVVASNKIAAFDPSKWLLSHMTIIASVDVDKAESGKCKKNELNYLIKPEYSMFVNNNGDSWERGLLKACYKTFLGADNYVEHVQIPELSKGKVIDIALREIPFTKKDGKDLTTLYVDILIATNRSHSDLIDKITSGEYCAASMGCLIKYSQCSQCGNIAEDDTQACNHVRFFKNNYFYDPSGVKRIIAELCGRAEDPESCKFIDASWVRKPAFEGAVLRNILEIGADNQDVSDKIKNVFNLPSFMPQEGMLLRAASEAAASLVKEVEAADEPAEEVPAPPADDTNFPEPSGGETPPLTEDEPPADAGADAAPAAPEAPMDPAITPDLGGGTDPAGAPPPPEVVEPIDDATTKEVRNLLKKQVLNQIRKELLQEEAKNTDVPIDTENEINDNLLKSASIDLARESTLRKVLSSAKRYPSNERIVNGIHILNNLKSWGSIKKYGYSRGDILGLLYHVDSTMGSNPVGADAVKALSKIKLASDNLKGFFTELIIEIGRKPTASEAKKLAGWGKILSNFD
jgi:hypothetical protein